MTEFNPYASPATAPFAGSAEGTGGPWRSGRLLVMEKTARLPDVCVTCHAPAGGFTLRRRLAWHSSWLYLLLLVAALIGRYGGRVVFAKRIDAHHAWIGGMSPALLAMLPEWRGASR